MTAVTLELPDDLVTNFDLKQLTKEFTDFLLSKNKPSVRPRPMVNVATSYSFTDEQNTQQLLEMIKNIKPVTCEYSSEQIVRSLREGTPLT